MEQPSAPRAGLAGTPTVLGTLHVELPCSLGNAIVRGRCALGAFSYLNKNCDILDCRIGRYCSIGANVLIGPGLHPIGYVTTHPISSDFSGLSAGLLGNPLWHAFCGTGIALPEPAKRAQQVVIDHDVWVGSNAIIMAGLHIGTGAIIGAGAVVTHDVAPYSIVAGNPARHLRFRLPPALSDPLRASAWWEYDLSGLGAERDYSDVARFLSQFAACLAQGRLALFEPETLMIEQGKTVPFDLRNSFMQEMEASNFAAASAVLAQGAGTRRQQALMQDLDRRHTAPFWDAHARKRGGQPRDGRPAPLEIGALPQGPAFLDRFRARHQERIAAPARALAPAFSTIFLDLNACGGGPMADALASLYFPWEVRDTVERAALQAFLREVPTLEHAIAFIRWHGGGWAVPFPRDRYRIFTLAREPVARFLSYYNTLLTHGDSPWVPDCVRQRRGIGRLVEHERETGNGNAFAVQVATLEVEAATLKAMPDAQLLETAQRILSERYFFVGVSEHYDASLLVACLLMGFERVPCWRPPDDTAQVAGWVEQEALDADARGQIERLFAVDIALYRWIKARFASTFALAIDFVAEQGLTFERGSERAS